MLYLQGQKLIGEADFCRARLQLICEAVFCLARFGEAVFWRTMFKHIGEAVFFLARLKA